MSEQSTRGNQGFASMEEERRREIASKGGKSVPGEERSFSRDHELAAEAGRRGGEASHGGGGAQKHQRAAEPVRQGGEVSHDGGSPQRDRGDNVARASRRRSDAARESGQH